MAPIENKIVSVFIVFKNHLLDHLDHNLVF